MLAGGLALRAVLFAFLGGFWTYLHRTETDRVKIFQLGLVGPAIVVAMIQGNLPKVVVKADETAAMRLPALVAPAYAQTHPSTQQPTTTNWDLLINGLLGTAWTEK